MPDNEEYGFDFMLVGVDADEPAAKRKADADRFSVFTPI